MKLKELINTVNELYYNHSSSYKVITSKATELLLLLEDIEVSKITDSTVQDYIQQLRQKGNKPATINSKLAYLSKLLNYAYRTRLITYKPLIPTIKLVAQKEKTVTADEYEQMLSYCKQRKLTELYQVIIIGYNTGIRISNILSLLPTDVEKNYIRIWQNKTNKPYSIPMNQQVQDLMKDFTGFTMNYRQVEYRFKQMIKDLQLDERITIHTLRHTICSRLVENNVPIPVVQALMNHSNIQTTMRYNHLKNEQLEKAVSTL